jgi:hypothetical protein
MDMGANSLGRKKKGWVAGWKAQNHCIVTNVIVFGDIVRLYFRMDSGMLNPFNSRGEIYGYQSILHQAIHRGVL